MGILCGFSGKIHFVLVVVVSVNILECFSVEDFPQLEYGTKYVCQNETMNLSCPSPSLLEVQAVSFGRAMSVICSSGANADQSCDLLDKKALVKQMCDYKSDCQVVANTETLGNNGCPGVDKYLNVIFACVSNPDVEYARSKPITQPPTTQPITTQPSTVNLTTPTTKINVTQAPNITRNVTTPAPKPLITPRPRTKNPDPPQPNSVPVFNPDGPALDFLARSGENSISGGIRQTDTMVVTGVCTIVSLFQWFL